jgi:hypothetical protein
MGLISKAGQLVKYAGQLAMSCACCIKYWCVPSTADYCGRQLYTCVNTNTPPEGALGPYYSPDCNTASCNPTTPCLKWWCFITGYSPCSKTLYSCAQSSTGAGAVSGPFDTGCPSCSSDYNCGANDWYCCYDQDQTSTSSQPSAPHCQQGPCSGMNTGSYARYSSGPHATQAACNAACQKHSCATGSCVPSSTGQYDSLQACLNGCGCAAGDGGITANPDRPPKLSTIIGQSNVNELLPTVRDTPPVALVSRKFSVASAAGRIAVSMIPYTHAGYFRFGTIRWQILGIGTDGAGNRVASRVMKADSGWRWGCLDGNYPCAPPADCVDGINGVSVNAPIQDPANFTVYDTIYWCKPAGITCFEVAVLSPCASMDYTYQVFYTPGSCNSNNLPDANPAP